MVNRIALGTVQFGMNYGINNPNGQIRQEEVDKILKYAIEYGVNTLDTANAYGYSEETIGKFIDKELNSNFKIITKFNPSSDNLINNLKNSFKSLGVKNVYGYLFHNYQSFLNNKNLYHDLLFVKEKGLVNKIGFSLYFPHELEYLINNNYHIDIVQIPYNLFDRRFEYLFDELAKRNIEIHIRSLYLQGLIFMEPNNLDAFFKPIEQKIKFIHDFAINNNIPISAIAMNFVLCNKFVNKVVIGVDNLHNFEQNLSVLHFFDLIKSNFDKFNDIKIEDENILLPFNWKIN